MLTNKWHKKTLEKIYTIDTSINSTVHIFPFNGKQNADVISIRENGSVEIMLNKTCGYKIMDERNDGAVPKVTKNEDNDYYISYKHISNRNTEDYPSVIEINSKYIAICYKNKNDILHREKGPAVIMYNIVTGNRHYTRWWHNSRCCTSFEEYRLHDLIQNRFCMDDSVDTIPICEEDGSIDWSEYEKRNDYPGDKHMIKIIEFKNDSI